MPTLKTPATYERLCKRLGELDKERRTILNDLRNSPEAILKYVSDNLTAFINSKVWFKRTTNEGDQYFQLQNFELDKTVHRTSISTTKHGSVVIPFLLTWECYLANSADKINKVEHASVSAFNDLETQILNGRKPAPEFDEKKVKKIQLTAKKKELEAELKKLKAELASV